MLGSLTSFATLPSPPLQQPEVDASCQALSLTAAIETTRGARPGESGELAVTLNIDSYEVGARIELHFAQAMRIIRVTGPSQAVRAVWRLGPTRLHSEADRMPAGYAVVDGTKSLEKVMPMSSEDAFVSNGGLMGLFTQIDADQSGLLDQGELQNFLQVSTGAVLTDDATNHILAEVDGDSNGLISFDEITGTSSFVMGRRRSLLPWRASFDDRPPEEAYRVSATIGGAASRETESMELRLPESRVMQ